MGEAYERGYDDGANDRSVAGSSPTSDYAKGYRAGRRDAYNRTVHTMIRANGVPVGVVFTDGSYGYTNG